MKQYRFLTFALLQNKRLLSRISFLFVLIIIPVSVFGMNYLLKEPSGVYRVAVCAEDNNDSFANEILDKLENDETVLMITRCKNEEKAVEMIERGECDGAWVLKSGIKKKLADFCSEKGDFEPCIKVLQREKSVSANLSREKLHGVLFPNIIYETFKDYVKNELSEYNLSDEETDRFYDSKETNRDIVTYEYLESGKQNKNDSYLISPIRGILAVLTVLCGLAAQMVFLSDKKSGAFDFMPYRRQIFVSLGITLVAVLDAAISVVLSMILSGVCVSVKSEIIAAVCLVLVSAAFCVLIGEIFSSTKVLSVLIPFIMLTMLLLSPIFFNLYSFSAYQKLFPPIYYLNTFFGNSYIILSLIYSVTVFLAAFVLNRIKQKILKTG